MVILLIRAQNHIRVLFQIKIRVKPAAIKNRQRTNRSEIYGLTMRIYSMDFGQYWQSSSHKMWDSVDLGWPHLPMAATNNINLPPMSFWSDCQKYRFESFRGHHNASSQDEMNMARNPLPMTTHLINFLCWEGFGRLEMQIINASISEGFYHQDQLWALWINTLIGSWHEQLSGAKNGSVLVQNVQCTCWNNFANRSIFSHRVLDEVPSRYITFTLSPVLKCHPCLDNVRNSCLWHSVHLDT